MEKTMDSIALAREARKWILKMTSESGSAHVGSALSVVDLLAVAYSALRLSPSPVAGEDQDHLILSKGHAASALYAVLALRGFFPIAWLDRYSNDGAELGGHVTHNVPGVNFSTGSLGHGLSFGVGLALSKKKNADNSRVIVVTSDGELNEGSVWEAALLANQLALDNLIILVDRNRLQSLTTTEMTVQLEPLSDKFISFGFAVHNADGHNHDHLRQLLASAPISSKPAVIICETTKGKGVSFMENKVKWHYRPPDSEELERALSEVEGS